MRIAFLTSILSVSLFWGCGNETRPDSYVSQPSVLLTNYNISHMRLHIASASSGILTFSSTTFTYSSPTRNFEGSWSATEYPTLLQNGDEITVIQTIDYTTKEGYSFSTNFLTNGIELDVGDTFIMTGDQILSGSVTQIEVNNLD